MDVSKSFGDAFAVALSDGDYRTRMAFLLSHIAYHERVDVGPSIRDLMGRLESGKRVDGWPKWSDAASKARDLGILRSEKLPEPLDPGGQRVDVLRDLLHEAVVPVGDGGALLRGKDDALLLQQLERVSDTVLGDAGELGQSDQTDGLVVPNGLEDRDVPLQQLQVLAYGPHGVFVTAHRESCLREENLR